MEEKKRYYIPAGDKKIYVEKEMFDEFNKLRSRQAYSNNKFRIHTCEFNEATDCIEASSVEEQVMNKVMLVNLAKAVRELDDCERKAISLIFFEGLSEREAAGNMGIERYQVNRIKKRALSKLKNKILI